MKWIKRHPILSILLLFILVLGLSLKWALSYTLGRGLEALFADEMQAEVQIAESEFMFFPLQGHVAGVTMRRPGEDVGVEIGRAQVDLYLPAIIRRRVQLENLILEGVRVHSERPDSAFINLMRFIIEPPGPNSNPSVKVKLRNLKLHTADKEEALRFDFEGWKIVSELVDLELDIRPGKQPIGMELETKSLDVARRNVATHSKELSATALIFQDYIEVQRANLQVGRGENPGKVHGVGVVPLKEETNFNLNLKLETSGQALGEFLPLTLPFTSATNPEVAFSGTVSGPLNTPELFGETTLELHSFDSEPWPINCLKEKITTALRLSEGGLQFKNVSLGNMISNGELKINFDKQSSFTANGTLALVPSTQARPACMQSLFDGANTSEGRSIWFEHIISDPFLTAFFSTKLEGSLDPFSLHATLESKSSSSTIAPRAQSTLELALENNVLDFSVSQEFLGRGRAQGTTIQAQGKLHLINKKLRAPLIQIRQYPLDYIFARIPLFTGEPVRKELLRLARNETRLNAEFSIDTGFTLSSLEIEGSASLQALAVPIIGSTDIEVSTQYRNGALQLKPIALQGELLAAEGELNLSDGQNLHGDLNLTRGEVRALASTLAINPKYLGPLEGQLSIRGRTEKPEVTAELKSQTESGARSSVSLSYKAGSIEASAELLEKSAELSFSRSEGRYALAATLDKFPLDSSATLPVQGTVSGKLELKSPSLSLRGATGSIKELELSALYGGVKIATENPTSLVLANNQVTFENFLLTSGGGQVAVNGLYDLIDGWSADIKGNWELAGVASPASSIEQLTGILKTDINLSGKGEATKLKGTIVLTNGTVATRVNDELIGLSNVTLRSTLEGDRVVIEDLSARSGAGQLSGKGTVVDLFSQAKRRVELNLTVEDLLFTPVRNFSTIVSSEITLLQKGEQPLHIRGDVELSEAEYTEEITLARLLELVAESLSGATEREITTSSAEPKGATTLDLSIKSTESFLVDTPVLEAQIVGAVTLTGAASSPNPEGTLQIASGTFGFSKKDFDIVGGELIFSDRHPDGYISLVGETVGRETSGREHLIQIIIEGPLDAPRSSFSSNTGLTEDEALGVLAARGALTQIDLLSFGGEKKRKQSKLSRLVRSPLETVSKLGRLDLNSKVSVETGEAVPIISFSRPLHNNVDLRLSSELAADEKSSAEILYRVNRNVSYTGSWTDRPATDPDRQTGNFGVGVTFSTPFAGTDLLPELFQDAELEDSSTEEVAQ